MRHLHRDTRDGSGQALVEFALILPIFILLLVGLLDLGRGVYAFNTISNASREAVRVGIVDQQVGSAASGLGMKGVAARHGVSLGITDSQITVCILNPDATNPDSAQAFQTTANCGPASGNHECTRDAITYAGGLGCVVQVKVRYRFVPATPIIGNLMNHIDMSSTTREPIEQSLDSCTSCP
jgi:Flp pilus assembly protein TadG